MSHSMSQVHFVTLFTFKIDLKKGILLLKYCCGEFYLYTWLLEVAHFMYVCCITDKSRWLKVWMWELPADRYFLWRIILAMCSVLTIPHLSKHFFEIPVQGLTRGNKKGHGQGAFANQRAQHDKGICMPESTKTKLTEISTKICKPKSPA